MMIVKRLGMCAAIVAATIAVYWRAASAYFFEDDFQWLASRLVFHPAELLHFGGYNHFYRPVIELYFWMAAPLFGGSPLLYHAANIALHAVNGLLVFLLVRTFTGNDRHGFLAALFFVVLPAYIEAVAWVGALAEPVTTLFACLSIYGFIAWRRGRGVPWQVLSLLTFWLALMTHESAVMIFPLIVLAEWAFVERDERSWRGAIVRFAPYVMLLAVYLLVDVPINRRSYLVGEGHYRLGLHVVRNLLDYVVSLYVGKRNVASYVALAAVLAALIVKGTPRVRFAVAWMLLTLLPFVFFTWGNTSRYVYTPAVGFAMLLAEGVEWLDRLLARRTPPRVRVVVVTVLVAFITIRFMAFAIQGARNFAARTEPYRRFITALRAEHPELPAGSTVPLDPEVDAKLQHRYLEALVRWDYHDPAINLVVSPKLP
jgi:hypothetical protein